MAASDKVFSVKLSQHDVPGAKFRCSNISEHSVCELKRWLKCRGLNISGQKMDLIDRCKVCIDAGGADEIIISIDGGKWYEQKVNEVLTKVRGVGSSSAEVPIFPTTGWKNFPAGDLPKGFCYGTIYEHIIASASITHISQSDSESDSGITDFNTSKPMLKGRQYFISGHVKNLKHQVKENFQFIKCSVMASYTIKTSYNICITMASSSGKVMDAACDCKASSMGRCNHIAAVLFAVEDYVMKFGHQVAPTSKLCTWNTGRKGKRDPQPCHSADYNKKMKLDRIINFDHRSEKVDGKMFVDGFIASLPNSSSNCMMQQVLEIKYSDYDVDRITLKRMTDHSINLSQHALRTSHMKYPIHESSQMINSGILRVTASNAKEVVSTKTTRGKYQLLLWGKRLPDLKALRYGKTHENDAFEAYCKDKGEDGLYKIVKSGLWINPKFIELGCSPDGLIYNAENLVSVLEIKCPLVLEKCHPINTECLKKKSKT